MGELIPIRPGLPRGFFEQGTPPVPNAGSPAALARTTRERIARWRPILAAFAWFSPTLALALAELDDVETDMRRIEGWGR